MFIFYRGKINLWRYRNITLLIWWTSFVLIIVSSILFLPSPIINLLSSDFSENIDKQESTFLFLFIFFGLEIFLINCILMFLIKNAELIMFTETKNSMSLHSELLRMNKKFIFIKKIPKNDKDKIIAECKDIFNDWSYDQWKLNFPKINKRINLLGINWVSYQLLNLIVVKCSFLTIFINSPTALIIYLCLFAIFLIAYYIWLTVNSTKAYKENVINKNSWILSLIPIANLLTLHSSLLKN